MANLTQLVNRTAARLSMVSGTAVQVYADDALAEMIQHKFDVLFDERFWPQFSTWATWTLDGTLGIVTTDLTDLVKRFDDIQVIFGDASNIPIPKLAETTTNPFTLSGTSPRQFSALGPTASNKTSRVFQMWPKAATGNIIVRYRTKPATFEPEDEIDFDGQALILGAVFDYLEDDGTNPAATDKFQALFEARVAQLKSMKSAGAFALDPQSSRPESFDFTALT
jgi:hypothetical protein